MAASAALPRPVLCAFLYPPQCLTTSAARCASTRAAIRAFSTKRNSHENLHATRPSSHQRRSYTTTTTRLAGRAEAEASRVREGSVTRLSKESMKDVIRNQGAHLDLGLMPGTLVIPNWFSGSVPTIFSGSWFRLVFHYMKTRLQERGSLLYYKYWTGIKGRKNKPKIFDKGMEDAARRLHWNMWTAFAEGNLPLLKQTCASGLYEDLSRKISRRGPGERMAWALHQYGNRMQLMSDRAATIPDTDGLSLRQIVVRVQSRQSLEKTGGGRNKKKKEGQEQGAETKEIEEYIVLQRVLSDKFEHPWVIWGTTKETDLAPIIAGAA